MTIRFLNKGKGRAEITLYGDIGPKWLGYDVDAKSFHEELRGLGDVSEIDLRINSFGGDVFDGLTIYRLLVDHDAEITAHIDGAALSIASVIAMAGDKIIMSESGCIMIHDPWTIALGNAAEFRAAADRLEATGDALADVYVKRTGNSMEKVRSWMEAETEFWGAEAVENKFADEIAANMKIAARAIPEFVSELRVFEGIPKDRRPYRTLDLAKFAPTPPAAPAAPVQTPLRDAARERISAKRRAFDAKASGRG